MPPPPLIDTSGRPIKLDRLLGSGGEADVFALPNDPSRVAKVYHPHRQPDAEKTEKLTAMIPMANPQLLTVATWPTSLLFHANTRKVAGFVMARLVDYQEIWHLYHPIERPRFFPRAGWTFQVRAAANLAAAFDEVHRAGLVVGDVQLKNAVVSPQALVKLVDCDSFQVRANGEQYLCEVGLAHYIPPELQGKPFRGLVRTVNHDRFGLAVLIFQLLFVGRHPYMGLYSGKGDPSFEQLITEFRFAQGPMAQSWGMAPPPHTPTFADLPPDVGSLFRRAFERGSETGTRPQAAEWLPALRQLEQNSVECAADPGHKYWRGSKGCVWCRLATNGGPEYFYGVSGTAGIFEVDQAKLQEALRRIAAARPSEFPYDRDRFAAQNSPEPNPLPDDLDEHRTLTQVLGTATALCVVAMPLGLFRGFICAIAFLAALVFGVWLMVLRLNSPWRRELHRRQRKKNLATSALDDIEEEWDRCVRDYHGGHSDLSQRGNRLVDECRDLARQHQVELQKLAAHAEGQARLRHLRLNLIADAEIPGIGAARKQTLAAYTILSAANVERNTIRGIKGFGEALTQSLMDWKDKVLREFRFDPLASVSPADSKALAARFRTQQQEILTKLAGRIAKLETLEPACRASLQALVPDLKNAIADYEQAAADFRLTRRGR